MLTLPPTTGATLTQFAISPGLEPLDFDHYPLVSALPHLFHIVMGDDLEGEAPPLNLSQGGTRLHAQSDRRGRKVLDIDSHPHAGKTRRQGIPF